MAAALCASAPSAARAGASCSPGAEARTVISVSHSHVLTLENGEQLRLADIEIPSLRAASAASGADAEAQAFLREKVVGRTVRMRPVDPPLDRYGRLRAYLFVDGTSGAQGLEPSVQQGMVLRGLARVAARVAGGPCAAGLKDSEREARKARAGLWVDPEYAVLRSDDSAGLRRFRGRFVVVRGRVLSVRESGATVYINFGRRWSEDFTVSTPRRNLPLLAAGGVDPKRMERRVVMVRGWLEERGGPWIELTRPEQIEVVGD